MSDSHWSIPTRYLVFTILLALTGWLIYFARDIVAALVISALIAYVLSPVVNLFSQRLRVQRHAAVVIVYLLFLALLLVTPLLVAPGVVSQVGNIEAELLRLQRSIETFLAQINIFGFSFAAVGLPIDFQTAFAALLHPRQLVSYFQIASTNLVFILISIVSVYYFLQDGDRLKNWVIALIPLPYQGDAQRLYDQVRLVWQAYLRGQLILMLFVGLLTGLSVAAVGLPGASLIGLLAGLLDIVPSLGPAIAAFVAITVSLFEGSLTLSVNNLLFAIIVALIFLGIQTLENVWLRPRVMGARLHLHPALVFIGVIGALALSGILAALVIVPVMSTVGILGRYLLRRILAVDPWDDAIKDEG